MNQRKWYKKEEALLEEIQEMKLSEGMLSLWYIGQMGLIVKYKEQVIYIDPVLNDLERDGKTRRYYEAPFAPEKVKADLILCTHAHADHMAEKTLKGIASGDPQTEFVVPAGCVSVAERMGLERSRVVGVTEGTEICRGEIRIRPFSTAHPEHVTDPKDEQMALGYELLCGGMTLIHTGDTYLTEHVVEELKRRKSPNVFMMPINGGDYFRTAAGCIGNMEAEEAALLAVTLGADLSIPGHYDMVMGNTVDPLRFVKELRRRKDEARFALPALGERIIYMAEESEE